MAGRTVRVGGVPTDIPPERVTDKLTIHFLRARNGGGEIADITLVAGSPACALVTFEEAGVARRVLEVENHVLLVGGKTYPLTVTAHAAELSPDEIFVRVCMIIDYGRLLDGKTLLRSLRKRYGAAQFSFDPKETLCTVKGPFTELQSFSKELLRSQQAGEAPPAGVSHPATVTGMSASQQRPRSPLPEPRVEKQPSPGQVHEEASEPPLHRDPVDGEAVEQLEDFSLVMDADIYLYMQKFCSDRYQQVLHQHQVDVVDVSSDGIAILYLQGSSKNTGNMSSVAQARLALLQLYQQLEASLRKEKISKGELSSDMRSQRALLGDLQKLCPLLLCHEDERHLYLIGNLVDVSQAKQYIQDRSTGRTATAGLRMSDASLATYTAALHGGDARLGKPEPTVDPSPPRLSPGKFEFKGEHKLAANFSFLKHDASLSSAWPSPDRSSLFMEQMQLSGSWLKEAGAPDQSDPAPPSGQHHLPVSVAITGPAAEVQQRDGDRRKGAPLLLRPKTLSLFAGGKESSTLQSLGGWKSPGPVKPQPISSVSSAFKSWSLFDTTGTCSALDSKPPESSAPLRRSNSFSIPKSKASDTPRDPSRAASGASEEISMDPVQWAYLKEIHGSAIDGLCREGGVLLAERSSKGCTVLMLTAEDRTKLLQARWKMEALCQTVCPALVCQSLSYSELDVEGPSDEALNELCSLLKGCSAQVRVSKDRYKLHLMCPKETLLRVNEAFQRFSARRRSALTLSSPSPGLEGSPAEEYPSPTQQVKTQDPALAAEYHHSREGLQQLEVSSTAGLSDLSESTPQLNGADTTRLYGPGWNATKTSSYQQAVGQEDPSYHSDSQDVSGSGLLDASLAGRQSLSPRDPQEPQKPAGEPETARIKRVLPDRFQFARDKSRAGLSEAGGSPRPPAHAADGAPQSLPIWLSSSGTVLPARAAAERAPKGDPVSQEGHLLPAGDGDSQETGISELELRGPSPGQETHEHKLGKCDACQSSCTATCRAQCGHALCRTCFAAEDTRPACCNSPKGARAIKGTFKVVTLSQSLPGYFRDPTLKIVYDIPDGVQEAGDPRPGRRYRGGRFQAFLPDNREGKKTSQLLQKAFEQGLTFQIQSCDGEERVTWHLIPHKTSFDKGKARNGYPDSQYLREVRALLRNLGIE
ncbi:protein zyg-11-like protein B [Platysternon megacephalum]|uniref:RING-type E3 ubiquitin transferase n=1 Tax=Platysternon megacephalum TaxID=55544 RepID=A0A4D9EKH8_9SAUR|nr:protein zyg-11-like protein B [Platysternon megacephalum]